MTKETTSTALVTLQPENALALFKDGVGVETMLADIRKQASSLVPDITTVKGRKAIGSVAFAVARTKTYLDDVGKTLTDEYKEIPKKIDATRKLIRDELDKLKDEVSAPLTAYKEAEEKRVAALQQRLNRITELGNLPANSPGASAEQLTTWLNELEGTAIDDTWQEKQTEAGVAKEAAILKVTQALEARKKYEAEQAELERLRQEQAKRDQEERERQIAEAARQAEADRHLQERATSQRRVLEAKEREEQARRDAEEAQRKQVEAEANAQRQAEEAAARAAEQERQRIAEQQQAEQEEADRRAADIEHRRTINASAVTAIMLAADVDPEQARLVVEAIARGKIPNVSISY
jgi:DNA repair exonuclease SbcCD ATPase subunit